MGSVVERFGDVIERTCDRDPNLARKILIAGYRAKQLQIKAFPGKKMHRAAQSVALQTFDSMIAPLSHPERSAIVSLFTPCELLQVAGVQPYSCEGFSCFLMGSHAERTCLQCAENEGLPETFCSYHKTFLGAAEHGLLPKPRFIVNTTLACDANLLTFRRLAEQYGVEQYVIDIPYDQDEDAVSYVAEQLRGMRAFIEQQMGTPIAEEALRKAVARSQRSMNQMGQYMEVRAKKQILGDMTGELYTAFAMHTLLGTEGVEKYTALCLQEAERAPAASGTRLLWMHTTPYWVEPMRETLDYRHEVQIVGCDMYFEGLIPAGEEDPYRAMARRLVFSAFNGPVQRRIDRGIEAAKQLDVDGAVWFCHWGCKHTLGGAQLAKKKFEEAGIPCLILDGDGCDRSHGGEGQMATRMEAFLEMLEENRT